MSKMEIFEPAMCCETGVCGVGVDKELLRIATVFDTLKKQGIEAKRYNLNSSPMAFVENAEVNAMLKGGVEVLPVTLVDGKVVLTKRYPSNEEIESYLNVKLTKKPNCGSCNCKGGCC